MLLVLSPVLCKTHKESSYSSCRNIRYFVPIHEVFWEHCGITPIMHSVLEKFCLGQTGKLDKKRQSEKEEGRERRREREMKSLARFIMISCLWFSWLLQGAQGHAAAAGVSARRLGLLNVPLIRPYHTYTHTHTHRQVSSFFFFFLHTMHDKYTKYNSQSRPLKYMYIVVNHMIY